MLALGLACCAPPSYDDVREDCGFSPDSFEAQAYSVSAGEASYVDRTCAKSLGRAMRLKWRSFGEEPQSFSAPTTTAQYLIAGLRTLVSSRSLTLNELQDAAQGMPATQEDLAAAAGLVDLGSDDAFGEAWYGYFVSRIRTTYYRGSYDGIIMEMMLGDDLRVYDLVDPVGPDSQWSASMLAAILVHEARHVDGYRHEDCVATHKNYYNLRDPECDIDADGAYGWEALWAYSWWKANEDALDADGIAEGLDTMFRGCGYIYDPANYWLCLEAFHEGYDAIEQKETEGP